MHRTWRNGLGGLAALLLAAGGLAGASTAAAATPPVTVAATGYFKIVNNRTGKCVDVPASSHATGTLLQEWDCHGQDNQRWAPLETGDGFFLLQSKNTPSMCVNVQILDGPRIDQEQCFAIDGEKWQWGVANSNGDLVLVSARPGNLCLGLSPNTDRNGTRLAAIPCSNTDSANLWHPEF